MPDGYSSGSDGYMTASINTAMSYASVVSNLTHESHIGGSNQARPSSGNFNNQSAQKAWNTPPPSMISTPNTDAELMSEFQSSRSEVEALKAQVEKLQEDKKSRNTGDRGQS